MANPKKSSRATRTPSVADPGEHSPGDDRRTPMQRQAEREEAELVELMRRQDLGELEAVIYRRPPTETEFGYVGKMPAASFTPEAIKVVYGGGDYKIQFKNGEGKFLTRVTLKIDYKIPTLYPGASAGEKEKPDRTPELVTALTDAMKNKGADPLVQLLIQQQGELMKAIAGRQPSGADSATAALVAELKSEVRHLREAQQQGGGRGSFRDGLRDFLELHEMLGGFGGGSSSEPQKPDRIGQLIQVLGPSVGPLLTGLLTRGPGEGVPPTGLAPALVAPADPGAAAHPTPTTPATGTTDENMHLLFKPFIAQFRQMAITAAAKAKDPFDWADTQLDALPEKFHDSIFSLANGENWYAEIFGAEPKAQVHLQWLLDMRNGILVRAFVVSTRTAAARQPRPEPEAWAKEFLGRVSPSFHDRAYDLTEPETWKQTFLLTDIDAVWLERLRVALENELGGEEEKEEKPPGDAAGGEKSSATAAAKSPRRKA